MKFQQKQTTLLLLFFLAFSFVASAQSEDTVRKKLILKTFEKDLSRTQQLAVLDKALGEKFDLTYELKLLLQNMDEEELDDIFKIQDEISESIVKALKLKLNIKGDLFSWSPVLRDKNFDFPTILF